MNSIEDRAANFILNYCKGPEYSDCRIQCFSLWRRTYGEDSLKKIRAIIKAKAKK